MEIYNYDENGKFAGISKADPSPLEPDTYLIPALATDKAPPIAKDGFEIYWNGTAWEYRELPKEKPAQPNEYSLWDETSWVWVEDAELKAKYLQQKINNEARAYLASTDWYVVRQAETGVAIPAEVTIARAEARVRIVEVV